MTNRIILHRTALEILNDDYDQGGEITNAFGIGQVNTTLLAEQIVDTLDLDESILDDETHELWDVAVDAGLKWEDDHDISH